SPTRVEKYSAEKRTSAKGKWVVIIIALLLLYRFFKSCYASLRDGKAGDGIVKVADAGNNAAGAPVGHRHPATPQQGDIGHLAGKGALKVRGGGAVGPHQGVGVQQLLGDGQAVAGAAGPERGEVIIIIQLHFTDVQFKLSVLYHLQVSTEVIGKGEGDLDAGFFPLLLQKPGRIDPVGRAAAGQDADAGGLPVRAAVEGRRL